MRKPILIDLDKYPKDKWIDLPQSTRIHPIEIKTIFDHSKMNIGCIEHAIAILHNGKIISESTGTESEVGISIPSKYNNYIITHTHPLSLEETVLTSHPSLPSQDLNNSICGMRAISLNKDLISGQIHDFTFTHQRNDMGDYLLREIRDIIHNSIKLTKCNLSYNVHLPMFHNISTHVRFNLARRGFGYTSVINLKTHNNEVYITKIKSTYQPSYL